MREERESEGGKKVLWSRRNKNCNVSTWSLACMFAHSPAPLTHSLATHCLLCSCAPLRSFVCSLAHSLLSSWEIIDAGTSGCSEPQWEKRKKEIEREREKGKRGRREKGKEKPVEGSV